MGKMCFSLKRRTSCICFVGWVYWRRKKSLFKVKVVELKKIKCQYLSYFENRFKTRNVKKTIVLLLWSKVKN